jgi:hypothetical protein
MAKMNTSPSIEDEDSNKARQDVDDMSTKVSPIPAAVAKEIQATLACRGKEQTHTKGAVSGKYLLTKLGKAFFGCPDVLSELT